jgi:predicted DNA-binding transcriptional regulator AlpA
MKILTYRDLKAVKGISHSKTHINRLVKAKKFPRPFKPFGERGINAWDEAVIDEFLEAAKRAATT